MTSGGGDKGKGPNIGAVLGIGFLGLVLLSALAQPGMEQRLQGTIFGAWNNVVNGAIVPLVTIAVQIGGFVLMLYVLFLLFRYWRARH